MCPTVEDQFTMLTPKSTGQAQVIWHSTRVALTSFTAAALLENPAYLLDFVDTGSL
jgi:hypothetical protein